MDPSLSLFSSKLFFALFAFCLLSSPVTRQLFPMTNLSANSLAGALYVSLSVTVATLV